MERETEKTGFTLIEMMIVVGVIALLVFFGLPAIRTMVNSLHTEGNTRAMINAALSTARTIAAKEQKYAGVRFQYAYNLKNPDDILAMPQYMIFIVNEEPSKMGGLTIGFRAVEGMEPVKLPDSVGVMDLRIRQYWADGDEDKTEDEPVDSDSKINEDKELRDTTSFSIIFSPSGKLVIHEVRTRNKDGKYRPTSPNDSQDDIFNSPTNIVSDPGMFGMFAQDDWANLGLGQERGRNSFIIYDTSVLRKIDKNNRWDGYLKSLSPVCINSYTGTIINK